MTGGWIAIAVVCWSVGIALLGFVVGWVARGWDWDIDWNDEWDGRQEWERAMDAIDRKQRRTR